MFLRGETVSPDIRMHMILRKIIISVRFVTRRMASRLLRTNQGVGGLLSSIVDFDPSLRVSKGRGRGSRKGRGTSYWMIKFCGPLHVNIHKKKSWNKDQRLQKSLHFQFVEVKSFRK